MTDPADHSPAPASALALVRLLQLASPALPVGAYTYSQGLEWAVECGWIDDEASAGAWIGELLQASLATYEAPLLAALMRNWAEPESAATQATIRRLNADYLASREGAELRAETVQMGYSLSRLLRDLQEPGLRGLIDRLALLPEVAFPTAWAGLAVYREIPVADAVQAYLWAWAENQVMAALKAVPLGQAAGQRLLTRLATMIPALGARALSLPEAAWSNLAPAFAIACACHETQYSRLFRS